MASGATVAVLIGQPWGERRANALGTQAINRSDGPVLTAMRSYQRQYARDLIAVVARETYDNRRPQRGSADQPPLFLEADFAVVAVGDGVWQGYRDVISVNGRPVPNRESELRRLFERPTPNVFVLIERINRESARFYNSPAAQAFYNPATCLDVISARHEAATTFELGNEEAVRGQSTRVLSFTVANALPNPYNASGRSLPAPTVTGRVWVEPTSGAIWRCDLKIVTILPTLTDRLERATLLQTSFAPDPQLKLLVPVEHVAQTTSPPGGMRGQPRMSQEWSERSTYSDYRQFVTFARIKRTF